MLLGQFTFLKGWESVYRGFVRFLRFTFSLCIPLYMLLPIYSKLGFVFRRMKGVLIQIEGIQGLEIHPIKHWLFRPFQGIGIGLHLLRNSWGSQIVTGSTAASILYLKGNFSPEGVVVTGI
jgi:hypothetical protein